MLKATHEMAQNAKMMASRDEELKAGAGVRQYNAVVERLQETDTIPKGIFTPLEEDDTLEALGVCCTQLESYLKGLMEDPAERKSTEEHRKVINVVGGMPNMENVGELIRQAMPEWLREQMDKGKSEAVKEEESENPEANMNDLESKMAELGAQMQVLAERMHREELSGDEIRKLADQMRELGEQQSKLAKQHAAIRAPGDTDEPAEQSDS